MASSSSVSSKARSSTKGVVVWEWFNEHGKWRPYSPEVVAYIDKEGQIASQVHLGTVSACLNMYTIDIPSMCQIRKGTGTSRPVRRVIYPAHSPPAQQVVWEFEGDQPGQWVPYDMEISTCLEQAQLAGQQMLDMNTLFQLPYSIHFTTMQQVRMNTGRTRKIRRSPLQAPYPSAGKTPRCFSKLTTILDPLSLPSTSSQHSSASSTSNSLAAGASGSGMQRGMKTVRPTSSSDSDSDSDSSSGMTLRVRARPFKRIKKAHCGQSGASGRKSSKSASVVPPSATLTSGANQSATSVSSAMPHSTGPLTLPSQTLPTAGTNPLSGPVYSLPTVSLVNVGPALSLPLVTYAQPLGAHLTHGFPPMTHLPPTQQQRHSHNPHQHQSHGASTQQAGHPSHKFSSPQGPSQPHHIHMPCSLPQGHVHMNCHLPGHMSHSLQGHVHTSHSSHGPAHSSSSWPSVPRSIASSSSSPSSSNAPSSSCSLGVTVTSQPGSLVSLSSLSGTGPSYQGPLTRNRVLKQQVVGPGSSSGGVGGSMMGGSVVPGVSGMNGVHQMMGHIPHSFGSAQPQGHPPSKSGTSQHLTPQQQQAQDPLSQRLQQMHQQLQQLQQKQQHLQQLQQQVPGQGSGSGYPFNMSAFVPSIGLNILPQSGLLLPGSGSGQHHMPSHPCGSGSTQVQHPAPSGPVTETLPTETKIVLPRQKKTKHKPKTAEEVLNKYMESIAPQENEDCCICYDALTGPSSYGEGKAGQFDVIQLNKCSHMFHRLCLLAMYDSSHNGDSLQCPTCKTIYGELMGNCPPGEMSYDILSRPLPGHEHCGTIRVSYYISPGVQGPEHPHPGQRFTARGFPRSGFLPDDNRGRKILKLLMLAFKRKLMFTIGQSATTGESDTVTWNEIHHKTEFGSNISGHGYPDPNYLDNVTAELALKGVMEQDL